jgi:hypothetical protein
VAIQSGLTGTIRIDNSDAWRSHTVEVNFAPKAASATVSLCQLYNGEDGVALGIKSFEFRDTRSGPNKKKDFSIDWQPSVFNELMTRVTFAVGIAGGSCLGGWTIYFWN